MKFSGVRGFFLLEAYFINVLFANVHMVNSKDIFFKKIALYTMPCKAFKGFRSTHLGNFIFS